MSLSLSETPKTGFVAFWPKHVQENLSKTLTLKKTKNCFEDYVSLNSGQKYCSMLQGEHYAIISTFIKLPFAIMNIFEWPFYVGFTVCDEILYPRIDFDWDTHIWRC